MMAYNDKKIVEILLENCKSIESRCPGYREEMQDLLAEVLKLEREHALARMNIAAKIADQVNALGMVLYRARQKSVSGKKS
jgi:hypothetical protein